MHSKHRHIESFSAIEFLLPGMKVLIEARALSGTTGVKTYTQHLLTHLLAAGKHDYTVVYDSPQHVGNYPGAHELVLPLRSPFLLPWWLRQFPRLIAREHPDVVHFTKADMPRGVEVPGVVTIYDVIPLLFPEGQKLTQRYYWPKALRAAAMRSQHIVTISKASKRDIITYLQVPGDKITVTPLAADTTHFSPASPAAVATMRAKYQLAEQYLLFVGTQEPRKNIPALLRAFARVAGKIPHQLVIAGKKTGKHQGVEAALRSSPVAERIRTIPYVDYQDLPALYTGAELFIWPSIYEGWGLPPLEAQACGTAVMVSDGGALPEVVGRTAIVVPFTTDQVPARPLDTQFELRLATEIVNVLQNSQRLTELRAQARSHAQTFRWEDVAAATTLIYEQLRA